MSIATDKPEQNSCGETFQGAWPLLLESEFYGQITTLGIFLGLPLAGLWAYKWLFREQGQISRSGAQDLAVLLLVLFLIGSPGEGRGSMLANVTQAVHRVGYEVSDFVLRGVNEVVGAEDVIGEVGAQNAARLVVDRAIDRCGVSADPAVRQSCFDSAQLQATAILEPWADPFNQPPWLTPLFNELFQRLQMARAATNTGTDFAGVVGSELSGVATSAAGALAQGFLLATGTAYLVFIEVAALATALLGPLVVGISLIPLGGRPLLTWTSGFIALGIARLTYVLIIAATSYVLYAGVGGVLGATVFPLVAGPWSVLSA